MSRDIRISAGSPPVKYHLSTRASQQTSALCAFVTRRCNRYRCAASRRGASLVEYVLLISLMALACFVALKYLGSSTARPYSGAASGLEG
jgi:hypothetical protein